MRVMHKIITAAIFILCSGLIYYFCIYQENKTDLQIKSFEYSKDAQAVEKLFHKGDNFYWMVAGNPNYSVDFMLKYATSSQYEKKQNMILKVAKLNDKVVGFLGYYPQSAHVWRLLFVLVDQDVRRQGVGKKIVKFALQDMVAKGAFQVRLCTWDNNFRSQGLYTGLGFKFSHKEDSNVVWFTWNK